MERKYYSGRLEVKYVQRLFRDGWSISEHNLVICLKNIGVLYKGVELYNASLNTGYIIYRQSFVQVMPYAKPYI